MAGLAAHTETSPTSTQETFDIEDKDYGIVYQYWLAGIRTALKTETVVTAPVDYRDDADRAFVEFPVEYPRFPAAGGREFSFDEALRVFYRKVRYASFRRVNSLQFQTVRPTTRYEARVTAPVFELSAPRAAKRRQSRRLTKNSYLTPSWRALLLKRQGRRRRGQ